MSPATLESANTALRNAVRERMLATDPSDPKCVGYKVDEGDPEPCGNCDNCEPRLTGDGVMNADSETYAEWVPPAYAATPADECNAPAEQLLLDALAVIRDRRGKYGGPRHHFRRTIGMINAAFGHLFKRPLTEADWAIFMTLDKVARYCGPAKTTDGPIDLAGYAACLAEVEAAL